MKIFLASDHTGYTLKEKVKTYLQEKQFEVIDCGAFVLDKEDDYPAFIHKAAQEVGKNPDTDRGIIFGGSGQGEAIVANKIRGVRCGVFYTPAVASQAINNEGTTSADPFAMIGLTREHNNANMLSLGVRFLKEEDVLHAISLWLAAPSPSDMRHIRRVNQIKELEQENA